MRAGLLRHRLEIQVSTETADSQGEPVAAWAEEVTVPSNITPLTGRELFSAQQVHAEISHKISLRYRSGVTVKKRGVGRTDPYNGTVFDFQSVQAVKGRTAELEILAVERIP
jgi:SPP1 family predicted phage head-tail adaptor